MTPRHHAAHPPSAVRPSAAVNQKPHYAPPETASLPVVSPRVSAMQFSSTDTADNCDPVTDDDCDDDRKKASPSFGY